MKNFQTIIALVALCAVASPATSVQTNTNPFNGQVTDPMVEIKRMISARQYDRAIPLLRVIVAKDPKNIQALAYLGIAYQQSKHSDLAVLAFQQVVALNSNSGPFYNSLGGALLDTGKTVAAREAFRHAVDLQPDDVESRFGIGSTYLKDKLYPEALAAYQSALGYSPNSPDIHNAIGDVLEQMNRHDLSVAEYETAIRLSPGSVNPIIGRSTALAALKRFSEAEKPLRELLIRFPKEASSHSGLAQMLDTAGRHQEAIVEYHRAIAITADDPYLWGNLGWALYNADRYTESIDASRKALKIDNSLVYVQFNIGLAYAVQGKYADAQREYLFAVKSATAPDIHSAINDLTEATGKHKSVHFEGLIDTLRHYEIVSLGLKSGISKTGSIFRRDAR